MRLEGQLLDHYQIIRIIGNGGMGDVYLAEDARIGQQVAIKVIWTEENFYSDSLVSQEAARLLRREARAISQLDHPHILPLYNYGETQIGDATLVYLVMPYRPEGSLLNWISQQYPAGPVPPEVVASLIRQAAEALQVAHDHQIIHQDIKPSNFLIRTQANKSRIPDILLSDFGIAHIAASSASSSQNLRGTPIYMSPEHCQGKPVFASDQYGLAVMTYELLTGQPPFQGSTVYLMYQHMGATPQPPSSLQPQLPRELDAVVLRALEKQPEKRFASVIDFASAFAQTLVHLEAAAVYGPHFPIAQWVPVTPVPELAPSMYEPSSNPGAYIAPSPTPHLTPPALEIPDKKTAISSFSTQPLPLGSSNPQASIKDVQPMRRGHDTPPVLPNILQTRRRGLGKLRWGLIAVSILLLLLLLLGGLTYFKPEVVPISLRKVLPHTTTTSLVTVTITPASKDLKQTYALSAVMGTPDPNNQQIQARPLSINTQASNKTVNATGQGMATGTGTMATGSLTFTNNTGAVQAAIKAGTTFTGITGVTVILDAATPVLRNKNSYTEPAHATVIGTAGNIPALDISNQPISNECRAGVCVTVVNDAAFTGGTDGTTSAVVQQSDIDSAANSLIAANQPNPQRELQRLIRSNEQLVGTPQCQPNVSSNHQAGDNAAQVTVSVTFTCTGEVYDRNGAEALAATLLTDQATTDLGTQYAPVRKVQTSVSNVALDNQGTVTLTVTTEGVWAYQFSQEQEQSLAKLVAGQSKQAAINLLQQQPGVSLAAIQLSDSTKQTLSSDPTQIAVVVQPIPES